MGHENSKTSLSKQTSAVPKSNIDNKQQIPHNDAHSNLRSLSHRRIQTVENFIVIWLDSNMDESNQDTQNSINHLRRIVNSIQTFTNPDRCIDYLNDIKDEKVFVIVSGSLGQQVVPLIIDINQLASIYVFCGDKQKHQLWTSKYPKIKGIFIKIEDLCKELKVDVRQRENDLTPISIISSSSTTDINELDQSFMYSQLFKEILLEDESTEEEKKELVDFCRLYYADNDKELKIIDQFERDYPNPSLIWWYTRQCFLYSMLNKALRTQDVDIIIKMGFVVRDLHENIEQLYAQQYHDEFPIVYRGQGMSTDEFEKIKKSKGGLLAFNNFLSTSIDRQVSLSFARYNQDLTAVLFQINIDPKISTTPFASVDKVGYFKDQEKEILFSMHTIFRIGETKEIEQRMFQVDLTLTNDNDQQLTRLTQHMQQATRGSTGLHRMAQLMIQMGEFDKAQEIYTTLIETTTNDDRQELAHLHNQFGFINNKKGDPSSALSHYQKSLDIKLTYLSSDDPRLSPTYSGIGAVLQQQDDLDSALKHFKRAFHIDLHASQPNQLEIAIDCNNIGLVLQDQGKYDEALKNFERALQIYLVQLPPRHPSLATTYNNIGEVHRKRGDNSSALSFFLKTLEIEQRSLPPHHPSLAITHNNLSYVLDALDRTAEAIKHAERAVDIGRRSLPPNYPQTQDYQPHLDELCRKL